MDTPQVGWPNYFSLNDSFEGFSEGGQVHTREEAVQALNLSKEVLGFNPIVARDIINDPEVSALISNPGITAEAWEQTCEETDTPQPQREFIASAIGLLALTQDGSALNFSLNIPDPGTDRANDYRNDEQTFEQRQKNYDRSDPENRQKMREATIRLLGDVCVLVAEEHHL